EQAAAPGEVLLAPTTFRLVRGAVRSRPAGDAFRLVELVDGADPFSRRLDTKLVNRDDELAVLRRSFDEVTLDRGCSVVTVIGEAGIGKTRLVRELTTYVAADATVLVGTCVSYGEGATYLPLEEMLAQA